ncbi:restriction endonuclease subunit S [Acholeplasma equifetale]|uniref:restriction endonuclease subunit S n=1 Tax=Acholeplasma equifetale TaxID=264634 RepID=UPI0006917B3F|nr:restriction endonuclease subunit S [Acholeplasma equifetale]
MNRAKIGDLCNLYSGGTPSTKCSEYWGGNFPWLSSAVSNQDFIYSSEITITQEGVDNSATRLAKKNSVLIATAGEGKTRGQVSYLEIDAYINQSLISIVPKKDITALYLYYYLKNSYGRIRKLSDITGIRGSLSGDLLKSFIIEYPDLDTQKKITTTLRTIDRNIENNKKIINELESMSKTLYDYWFLQFEFPNKEGKPYRTSGGKMVWNEELKREIPEGWEVKNAYEIADIKTGKEDANHATKNGKYPFFTCANDVLRCDDYKFDGNVILIAGNGDFNVKHYNGKFNAYQRTYVITPHNDKYVGVFHLSCKQTVEKFIKGSNGSIVKFITLRDIQNIKILDCKNDKLLEPFNVFLEKIDLLKKENQELSSLRDFLLPLLMNGQVKFKDK